MNSRYILCRYRKNASLYNIGNGNRVIIYNTMQPSLSSSSKANHIFPGLQWDGYWHTSTFFSIHHTSKYFLISLEIGAMWYTQQSRYTIHNMCVYTCKSYNRNSQNKNSCVVIHSHHLIILMLLMLLLMMMMHCYMSSPAYFVFVSWMSQPFSHPRSYIQSQDHPLWRIWNLLIVFIGIDLIVFQLLIASHILLFVISNDAVQYYGKQGPKVHPHTIY